MIQMTATIAVTTKIILYPQAIMIIAMITGPSDEIKLAIGFTAAKTVPKSSRRQYCAASDTVKLEEAPINNARHTSEATRSPGFPDLIKHRVYQRAA